MSAAAAFPNDDMLAWFGEDERALCTHCGQRACVGHPDARAAFCLSCGAVTIEGVRIDVDRRISTS